MYMRTFTAVLVLVALAPACGSATSDDGSRQASQPAVQTRETTASEPKMANVPPAAFLETPRGRVKLSPGTYCWTATNDDGTGTGMCVDMVPPEHRPDLAEARVETGDRVTLHLGFTPKGRIHVTIGDVTRTFQPSDTVSWTVEQTGILSVFMYAPAGDVSYDARLLTP